jgi:predicted DNA-binding ribbon-helix-helix protein
VQSSVIKKRSIIITRHKTSISLEDEFWESLREIAKGRGEPLSQLIADIDEGRQFANLSSAIRLFILRYYRDQLDQQKVENGSRGLGHLNSREYRTQ